MSTKEHVKEEIAVKERKTPLYEIMVYNDDYNTFDHVIDTLIDTCDHDPHQAEQCTIIIHYNGKCAVKTGEYKDLKSRCTRILEAGINAEIV